MVAASDSDCMHLPPPRRRDGELRAGLRSHLASLQPVELVVPHNAGGRTRRVLRGVESGPRLNELPAAEVWDGVRTRRELRKGGYWPEAPPAVLQVLAQLCSALSPQGRTCVPGHQTIC